MFIINKISKKGTNNEQIILRTKTAVLAASMTLIGTTLASTVGCSKQTPEDKIQQTNATLYGGLEEQLAGNVEKGELKTFDVGQHLISVRIYYKNNYPSATYSINDPPEGYEVFDIVPFTIVENYGSSTVGYDIWFKNTEPVEVHASYNDDYDQYGYFTFGEVVEEEKTLTKQYDDCLEEESKLNTYLMNIPNAEAITKAIEQKKIFGAKRDSIIAKRGAEEAHKKDLDNQYVAQDKKLKALIDKNKQLQKVNAQVEYCKKCRNILKETRLELLAESRLEMEQETLGAFTKLLWKKDAFSKVEILEDYTFRLIDNYGAQTLGSCSAAERALLALSFTLALQKVSMHDSLLFIDTPIGRVDPDNRQNFVNTLCEIAKSKQVILTFTPAEYDVKVAAALQGKYASLSELIMEDGVTVIK